jgi:hypothetical protein
VCLGIIQKDKDAKKPPPKAEAFYIFNPKNAVESGIEPE